MDTKKLRQKILDLAIHGKLVPQDPNDEPASVLLDRIRAEKERLIAEGKIKRSKKSATSDTSHYENVPQGWCISTIGEVFNLQAGKNISANDIHECSQNFPYACYGGNGIRGYVSDYNRDGKFPIIGRQGALCGNVNFAEGKFYATEHAVVVTCFAGVNIEWARYVLEAMNLNQYATATAQPGLSVATVNEVEFMLPPLNEQCRIAEFIANCFETIESLTTQTNDLRLNLDKAKSKILDLAIHGKLVPQDASDEPASELLKRINPKAVASCDNPHYAEPYELPDGWTWCKLIDICTFLSRGKSPKYSETDTTYPVFAQKCNLKEGGISLEKAQFLEPTTLKRWPDVYHLQTGDVLVNSTGTGTVGRTRLFNESCLGNYPFVVPDSHVSVIRTHGEIVSEYIFALMSSSWIQTYLEDNLAGSTNQKELYIGVLQNVDVPLPPVMEQTRIADKIESLYQQLDNIANHIE